MDQRTRTWGVVAGAVAAVAMLMPSAASAGLLADSAEGCAPQSLSQPFLPWLDPMSYTMPEGGSFEDGAAGWTLKKGAKVVSGNEPYKVRDRGDSYSLKLPAGSTASSATMCVGIGHPTLRFFARNTGSILSALEVKVRFLTSTGKERRLPIAAVVSGGTWQPTLPYPVVANLLPLLPGEKTPVAFEFTPLGIGGAWQIDDVYVDPYRRS